jgi:hypothetical protein
MKFDEAGRPFWADTEPGRDIAKLLRRLDRLARKFPDTLNKRQRQWMREIQKYAQPRQAPTKNIVAVLKEKIDRFEAYLAGANAQQRAKSGRLVSEAERIAHTQDFARRRRLYLSGGARTPLPPTQHETWWRHHRSPNPPQSSH